MTRFNYLVSPWERLFGIAPPSSIAPHLRLPLFALVAAVVLVGISWAVQDVRLRAARADGDALTVRLAALDGEVARTRTLQRGIERLRALDAHLAEIRRSGAARASTIAALGNELPHDAWLTSVRVEHGAIEVEGRGARLATVGAAMRALAKLPAFAAARLLAVHGDAAHASVTYAIALEARP